VQTESSYTAYRAVYLSLSLEYTILNNNMSLLLHKRTATTTPVDACGLIAIDDTSVLSCHSKYARLRRFINGLYAEPSAVYSEMYKHNVLSKLHN